MITSTANAADPTDFFAALALIVAAIIAALAWHQLYREYRERTRR